MEIGQVLERVGLSHKAKQRFTSLSGGQKRRVLFARALLNNPSLLIMDEPTAFTDRETVTIIQEIIEEIVRSGSMGILASTHDTTWVDNAAVVEISAGEYHG